MTEDGAAFYRTLPMEGLIKSTRVDGERFFVKARFGKRRNTLCISSFSNRRFGEKDPPSTAEDLFRASLSFLRKLRYNGEKGVLSVVPARAGRIVCAKAGQRRHSRGRTESSAPTGIPLGRTRVSAQADRVVCPEAGQSCLPRGRTESSTQRQDRVVHPEAGQSRPPRGRTETPFERADRVVRPGAGQSRPALRGEKYGVRPCRRRYAAFKCYGVL